MADNFGLDSDVYFGDADDDKDIDWREEDDDQDDDNDDPQPGVEAMLGFNPDELDDEE